MNAAIIVPIMVALITPVGAYLLAARRMSGRIATSDATELWAEAGKMRQDYRDRLAASEDRAARVEARMARLEEKHSECLEENAALRRMIAGLEARLEATES